MTTTRRQVIAAGAAGAAGLSLLGPLGARAAFGEEREIAMKPALVVLFLRGGQDALNTLVPYSDGKYYDLRPNIGVPPPGEERGALDLDGTFGLNPALEGFKNLWDKGMLAPIVNCGCPHPSRSHFDQQDFFEYGAPGDKSVRSGWLNRYLETTMGGAGAENEFRAVAMQGRLPRSLRGEYPVLAVPQSMLSGARRRGGTDDDVLELFDDLYAAPPSMTKPGMMGERPDEDDLTQNGRTTIKTLRKLEEILQGKQSGKQVRYPADLGALGRQLSMAARILKSGQAVQVIAMDWNGWDHHIREGGSAEGDTIHRMLRPLGSAIELFFEDIWPMRKYVNVLVMTEFGRTNRENGNLGTDHGRGGHMYLIGGNVKGGKVYGDWDLAADRRELPVTTDFRRVYTEVLQSHLKLHPSKNLFKGWTQPAALDLY